MLRVNLTGVEMNVHEFVFMSIDNAPMPLRNYQGQPILFVNTASECEFTPQLQALERIWKDYQQSGLIVIAMPCNDFGQQEPGTEEEIAEFYRSEFGVTFLMTGKYNVMGLSAHPMFSILREEFGDDVSPRWNFYKYLFDRNGQFVEFWPSKVRPEDPAITHQIECNLQSWVL